MARLYGHDPEDGVGGDGAFFLLLDEPEVYGLPPDPVVTTRDLSSIWKHVGAAALTVLGCRRRCLRRETPVKEPRLVPDADPVLLRASHHQGPGLEAT